ncbi:phage tail tape measure protein [Myxococcus sp. NMCA1]|uniref:phage tail tape measure protein n=1 Tax=Myxococcus sp. NMCA1 TaxID=2996785 RepID=UPI0022858621|nr:phage tail tape measure protein [Myxococcus sp. NMCA1]WAM23818.1 phage tail tape measure protein [Myxococcus sp. NMCA1]
MSSGTDLATLSVRIDTSDAKAGSVELTKFSAAAEKTETATKKTETATEQYSKSLARMVKEANETNQALARMRTSIKDMEAMGAAATAFQGALKDASGLDGFKTRIGALDAAAVKLHASFADTSAVSRFMGELGKASTHLSRMQVESSQAATSVQDVKRSVEGVEKPVNRLSQELGGLVKSFLGLAAVIATVIASLTSAASEALAFDTAMAQVSTLLEGDQVNMMGALADRARELGVEFGRAPTEQVKALYEIMSAGASDASQATDLLRVSNKLAIGGVTEVGVAADGLTSIMASYGSQLRDATEAADAMFVSAADGKTSIEAIARHIGKIAPIAAQTGVSLQELLAANAALTKAGIKTETAMEGMRAILAQVAKPSNEARDLARALGIEFNTAGLKARGLAGFLEHLKVQTGGSTELLAKLVGGVEALLPAMTLTGSSAGDFATSLKNMESAAGRTEVAFSKMAQTPQFALDQLKAKFDDLEIAVGQGLLAQLMPGIELLSSNFTTLSSSAGATAQAVGILLAARGGAWAAEWVKSAAAKASALVQSRQATTNAALAEAGYVKAVNESSRAALRNAAVQLEARQSSLQQTAPFMRAAHAQAAIAANDNALAQVRAAQAMYGAAGAGRVLQGAMAALGGPIGVAITAIGLLTAGVSAYIARADEAAVKARELGTAAATSVGKSASIVSDLLQQTRATTDAAKAAQVLSIARKELAALGGDYQTMMTDEVKTADQALAVFEKVAKRETELNQTRVKSIKERLQAEEAEFRTKIRNKVRMDEDDPRLDKVVKGYEMGGWAPKIIKTLREDLQAAMQDSAELEKALARVREAAAKDPEGEQRAADAAAATARAREQEAERLQNEEKARAELAKSAARYLAKLEEEAATLGLAREGAEKLTAEYKSLNYAQRLVADAALEKIAAFEAKKKADEEAKKRAEEHARALEQLNQQLGDADADRMAKAVEALNAGLAAGTIKAEEYGAKLAKARTLWTKEGKEEAQLVKDMELLQKQLNPLEEVRKRVALLNKLLQDERISMEAYQKEMVRLHSQMSDGFSIAQDAVSFAAQHMEDAITTFATSTQFTWRGMIDGMLKDLSRLLAHKAFVALVDIGTTALLGGITGASFSAGGATAGAGVAAGKSAFDMSAPAVMKSGAPYADGAPKLVTPPMPSAPAAGGVPAMSFHFTFNQDGSVSTNVQAPGAKEESRAMARQLQATVLKLMVEQLQPGGVIYNANERKRR